MSQPQDELSSRNLFKGLPHLPVTAATSLPLNQPKVNTPIGHRRGHCCPADQSQLSRLLWAECQEFRSLSTCCRGQCGSVPEQGVSRMERPAALSPSGGCSPLGEYQRVPRLLLSKTHTWRSGPGHCWSEPGGPRRPGLPGTFTVLARKLRVPRVVHSIVF